jgi:hypothetical protein
MQYEMCLASLKVSRITWLIPNRLCCVRLVDGSITHISSKDGKNWSIA